MDEPKPTASAEPTPQHASELKTAAPDVVADSNALARGSGTITKVPDVPVLSRARTEDSVMEGLPTAKMERIAAMRRDLAELQRQLTEAQQRIATELQGRADDAERFENLEEELRLELAAREAQLENKSAALNEARSLLETRVVELGTRDSEILVLKSERDALKREIDEVKAKARDIGNRIVQFGQGLLDGRAPEASVATDVSGAANESKPVVSRTVTSRQQPPPLPRPKTEAQNEAQAQAQIEPAAVETILEVIEEPKPRAARSWLMLAGGVLLGCAATFAYARVTAADTSITAQPSVAASTSEPRTDLAPAPIAASETSPRADTTMPAAAPAPTTEPTLTAAGTAPVATAPTEAAPAATTSGTADGVLVLPSSAAGHRIYVDDKIVEVKDMRASVHCGSHQVRIGSHGTSRTLDVTCGGETPIPADE